MGAGGSPPEHKFKSPKNIVERTTTPTIDNANTGHPGIRAGDSPLELSDPETVQTKSFSEPPQL